MPISPIKYTKLTYLQAPGDEPEKKEAEITPPQPPQMPEYFPGYSTQYRSATQQAYETQQRVSLAQQGLTKLQSPWSWQWGIPKLFNIDFKRFQMFPWGAGLERMSDEEFQAQRQVAQQELDLSTAAFARASWRRMALIGLPMMLADENTNIYSAEDYLRETPDQYKQFITDEDRAWLEETTKKLAPYTKPKLPEQYAGMSADEVKQAILNDILDAPSRATEISLHRLTVEEIIANLQRGKQQAYQFPPGLTAEDIRDLMGSVDIDEETQAELSNIHTAVTELQQEWAEEAGYIDLVRQGLLTPEAPELTPWEFTKLLATQPVMATLEVLDKYFNMQPRPSASMAITKTLGKIKPDSPAARLTELHQHYMDLGLSNWQSYTAAWNTAVGEATRAKGFWKGALPYMIAEALFDPTTYIGMGVLTRLVSKIPGVAGRTILPSGMAKYTGAAKYVGAFERGFNYSFEYTLGLPIKAGLWGAGKAWAKIPKPTMVQATTAGRASFLEIRALLNRMYPERRNLTHITINEVKEAVNLALDQYAKNPMETGNLAVRAGQRLVEFDHLVADDLTKLLKGIVDTGDITEHSLAAASSDIAEAFKGVPNKEVAGKIIGRFGDVTEDGVAKLAERIDKFKARTSEGVTSLIEGASARDALLNISRHVKDTVHRNLNSPTARYMEQAGKSVSWLTRQTDNLLASAFMTGMEKKLVSPVANWYLLFANLGPYNFAESVMRSWLGGGELLFPRKFGGFSEASRFFKGVSNAPYEFIVADKAAQRLDVAAVRPSTGETVLMQQGKIPLITKDTRLGLKMSIHGKDYHIGSAQSYNAMWGDMVTKQRAWDTMVQYRKALYEIAPNEVGMIDNTFIYHRNKLDEISAWNKADKRDIERALWQDTIGGGPEALLEHMDLTQNELQKRMILKGLRKELDRATEVPTHVKEMMADEILEGTALKDIPGRVAAYKEFMRETDIVNLKVNAEMLQDTVKNLVDAPPATLGELQADMKYISDMAESLTERLHDSAAEIKLRGNKLLARQRDNFYEASYQQMSDFMQVSEAEVEKLLKSIESQPLYTGIDDAARLAFDDVKDVIRLRYANVLKARERNIDILSQIRKTPRKSRDDNFWQAIQNQQEKSWSQFEVNNSRLFKDSLRAQRRYMNSTGKASNIAEFVPEVTKELTPNHLAYLMGVTGSDLYRGLTKVSGMITARPKQQFIDYFSEAAEAYAAKFGKTTADIGFTDDAISGVYDQLWESLGIDAKMMAADPMSPSMLQLDGIGQELERLTATTKLPDADYTNWRQYVRGVADDVGKLPQYQKVGREYSELMSYLESLPEEARALAAPTERFITEYSRLAKEGLSYPDSAVDDLFNLVSSARGEVEKFQKWAEWRTGVPKVVTKAIDRAVASPTRANKVIAIDSFASVAHDRGSLVPLSLTSNDAIIKLDRALGSKASGDILNKLEIRIQGVLDELALPEGKVVSAASKKSQDWLNKKESAMTQARQASAEAFPTYGEDNIADAIMHSIFPFWCVPEDTKILTKSGWKYQSYVEIGEEVLTVNSTTLETEWQPVQKIEVFDYDDELMVIPAKGKDITFTPNHRWLTITENNPVPKIKRGYELTDTYDMIPRALPHKFPEESILSPRLSAILGWVVTEGYLRTPKKQRPLFCVYQSRYGRIDDIEIATGTKALPRSKENDPDNMLILVSADDTEEILRVYHGKENLPAIIPQLSKEAAESMWRAMLLGEGSFGKAYNGTDVDVWIQKKDTGVSEAFQMLSILMGKAITVSNRSGGLEKIYFNNNRKPYQAKQCRRIKSKHYTGKVWCPVTANGTWFANFNGCILPTGNTYEKFRWKWLPQNLIRKPFLPANLARYVNYTDQGYAPIPGTDLQMNILRGSIFMGGMRRLYMKDFPEYYDAFPGMEMIDYIGRLGFYPGIHVLAPMVTWGALAKDQPEWGELLPAWMKSPLNAARAIAPEAAGKVIDHVFPDRFREYVTMLEIGRMGYDADEIWRKIQSKTKLTEDEEKLWLKAGNKATGLKGILMEQTGLFRIRPAEYTQMQQEMKELIAEMTGVPVEVQDEIQRHYPVTGKRFSDYFKLDALQQKILYQQETYKRWQGVTTPLYPSSWQAEDVAIKDYYETIDQMYKDYRKTGIYDEQGNLLARSINDITSQWVRGEIGPDQWLSARSNNLTQASAAAREIGSRAYPDVPKSLEEREARYVERGLTAPTYSPDQELMYMYYDIKPELAWNWESGREEYDYDAYFSKLDIFLETLQEPFKSRFLERVQSEWNGMERLHWQVSKDFLRPYRNVRNVVLNKYSPAEQMAIRRFEVARGDERDLLRSVVREDGKPLISAFQSDTREIRHAMRQLDPDLDAWLYFFGTVDTFQTEQARELYNENMAKYMNPSMAQ